ncbi:hypothetical protein [Prevotellamassilia timonensis]|uniref:hypothetical protein n=1 Tax=Prevotellamassilia timonensis TaxID=1852370 RepID=UPI00307B765B
MWIDIIIALASALIGTYFGTYFLAKREEKKVKKVRAIAIRTLNIIKEYAKHNGTYDKACQELNTKLNIAEKRAVIVALHKIGLPIQTPVNAPFDIKNIQLSNGVIDKDLLEDAKTQIEHGYCDHLLYVDPDKYFSENLRIDTLRNLARKFVDTTLAYSTYKKDEEMIYFPESWLTSYSWGEKKAIWVFKCQVTSNMYFHNDGTPDKSKLEELKTEVSTGLWDNYLFWAQEAYDNLMQGSNLTNRFLQIAVPQQNTNQQNPKTDENR